MATVRKVFKQGSSWVIALPSYMMHHIGIEGGDSVYLEISDNRHLMITNPNKERKRTTRLR